MPDSELQTADENKHSERAISRGLYVATLILFCFPFVEISCEQGRGGPVETRSRSGLQMALGGHTTTRADQSRGTLSGERGNPWMTLFALAVFTGLVISVVAPDRKDWSIAELVCGSVAQLALLFQFVFLETYRSQLGEKSFAEHGTVTGRYTFWLMLTFVSSVTLVVLAVRRLLNHRRTDGQNDNDEPDTIPIIEPLPD
ncbi:MAG: hypothetical protein H8E37_01925 [Planctomycetes bacterium]|nr:hypothetical protein [Planctomycetota bacterium]